MNGAPGYAVVDKGGVHDRYCIIYIQEEIKPTCDYKYEGYNLLCPCS